MQDVHAVPATGTPPRRPGSQPRFGGGRRQGHETTEEKAEQQPAETSSEKTARLDLKA